MGSKTEISWTDSTWSPLRARVKDDAAAIATSKGYTSLVQIAGKMAGRVGPHCEAVSHGCDHCYSDTNNGRCLPSNGTGLPFDRRSRDLVDSFVDEKALMLPLKWRPVRIHADHCLKVAPIRPQTFCTCRGKEEQGRIRSRRIFVENQADLFGEWNSDEMIDCVFAVMALRPQHTFQVLTKRPERMLAWCLRGPLRVAEIAKQIHTQTRPFALPSEAIFDGRRVARGEQWSIHAWPLPNVWLGVSCEDQKTADARIPLLLRTPAAVRFVSYEPALGPVDFSPYPTLDLVIVGGESGSGARPFDIQCARDTIRWCKSADVACFLKQVGAKPFVRNKTDYPAWPGNPTFTIASMGEPQVYPRQIVGLKDRKGGDMAEWPSDLQVREFPAPR